MYIIREVFIAKPGRAGELAALMKKEMTNWKEFKGHVLLDMVTDYNTIVVQYELESLAAFEAIMDAHNKEKGKAKKGAKPPKYTEMYQTGRREIYRIVE